MSRSRVLWRRGWAWLGWAWLGLPLALALAIGASGCASTPNETFLQTVATGKRASHAGRYVEAAEHFLRAAEQADRVKDRDEALFMAGRAFERAGDVERAEAAYRQILKVSPNGPRAARADFEVAKLAFGRNADAVAYDMLLGAAKRHPDHGVTESALLTVFEHTRETDGETGLQALLRELEPTFDGTEQEQILEYELAQSYARQGELQRAEELFAASAREHPYPEGPLTDNALFRASEIAEERGSPERAVDYLERMLASREEAHTMGSYDRPRYPEARLRIARLYRDAIGDDGRARQHFQRLFDEHPTSVLRDDALWELALSWLKSGDAEEACDAMRELVDELPESRYAHCGPVICPNGPASPTGTPCRDYIVRDLEEAGYPVTTSP